MIRFDRVMIAPLVFLPLAWAGCSSPEGAGDGAEAEPQADPIQELPAEDREVALAQGVCPITDLPLGDHGVPYKMVVEGRPVFLCCAGCEGAVEDDPGAALAKLGLPAATDAEPAAETSGGAAPAGDEG